MDPPPHLNERQLELYQLAIQLAPRGLLGAIDVFAVRNWAMATCLVEVGGPLPMLVKLQRRATVELGLTPSARARVNADAKGVKASQRSWTMTDDILPVVQGTLVGSDLSPGEWNGMTVTQRILRCREYAEEAELLARTAPPDHRLEYKRIAAQWNTLAAELETFGRTKRPLPAFPAG